MSQAAYYDSMTNEFKINGGSNHSWGSAAPRSLLGLDASSQLVGYLLTDRQILQGRTGNTPLASTNIDIDDLKVRGNVTLLGQVASDISPSLDNTWSLGSAILSWMYIWVRNVVTAALNVSGLARFTSTSTVIFESAPQLTTATASSLLSTDSSKNMHSSVVSNNNGCNTVVDVNGDINFSMTQNLDPSATVEFVGERLSGLTASSLIATNATKDLVSAPITNNNGNALSVSAGGAVTASLAQDIRPTASTTFVRQTLTATTNQLTLGITNTTTLNSVAPIASRVVTIPDAGANSSVVLTESAQTINGGKTFSGITTVSNTTESTSSTTGALVVAGGLGIAKRIHFPNATANRKIVLYEAADDDHQFYGFGIAANMTRYQCHAPADHVFYESQSGSASTELFRILGDSSGRGCTTSGGIASTSTTDSTSTSTGSIKTAGGIGCAKTIYTGLGIMLPDASPTQTLLSNNAYTTTVITITAGISGASGNFTCYLSRVGHCVTFTFPTIQGTSNNTAFVTSAIPAGYRPPIQHYQMTIGSHAGGNVDVIGRIETTGVINWFLSPSGGNFSSGTSGPLAGSFSWTV